MIVVSLKDVDMLAFFQRFFSGGTKSIVWQISIILLILLLFWTKFVFSGETEVSQVRGRGLSGGGGGGGEAAHLW